ncbi:hypothetical protein KIN20_026154, partial [Parelaphostrongylus tenuis]
PTVSRREAEILPPTNVPDPWYTWTVDTLTAMVAFLATGNPVLALIAEGVSGAVSGLFEKTRAQILRGAILVTKNDIVRALRKNEGGNTIWRGQELRTTVLKPRTIGQIQPNKHSERWRFSEPIIFM